MQTKQNVGEYSLAVGDAAVRRLTALHRLYGPAARRILPKAGLTPGMTVADFGCGVGATTRGLAELVGPSGKVTGIDLSGAQVEQGRALCRAEGLSNVEFIEASAVSTGLPRNSFDLAYCRFLLLHLTDPAACLAEMLAVIKPGGILIVEDGDLTAAGSSPVSSIRWFADLFSRLGPTRGLDYSLAKRLYHLVKAAGVPEPEIEIHQPALARGEERALPRWSLEEAAPAFVGAGLVTENEMRDILSDMKRDELNPDILILAPPMSFVWGRKPN